MIQVALLPSPLVLIHAEVDWLSFDIVLGIAVALTSILVLLTNPEGVHVALRTIRSPEIVSPEWTVVSVWFHRE